MNTILERIKEAYHLETDAEVADFLGIKPSTLSMQKNRGRLNLQRIIEKCSDLNKNWLLDGEGEMRQNPQSRENRIPIYSSLSVENHTPDLHKSIKAGSFSANVTDELQNFSSSDQVIGYVISNDSMEPILKKNDIAIIDMNNSAREDGIFLISSDQKVFFSRSSEIQEQRIHKNGMNMIGEVVWILRRLDR